MKAEAKIKAENKRRKEGIIKPEPPRLSRRKQRKRQKVTQGSTKTESPLTADMIYDVD
jgi:hypothetical protein